MIGLFHQRTIADTSATFAVAVTLAFAFSFISCADKSADTLESSQTGANALPAEPVKIRFFDDNCKETNFINKDAGGNAVAHLKLMGTNQGSHAIGFYGDARGATVNFQQVTLTAPVIGSYSYEVVIRDKAACLDEGEDTNVCTIPQGLVSEKRSFDVASVVNFVIADPNPPAPPGELDRGIFESLFGRFINRKENVVPADSNINRCANGVPPDIQ